jgi:hypothetical protein
MPWARGLAKQKWSELMLHWSHLGDPGRSIHPESGQCDRIFLGIIPALATMTLLVSIVVSLPRWGRGR